MLEDSLRGFKVTKGSLIFFDVLVGYWGFLKVLGCSGGFLDVPDGSMEILHNSTGFNFLYDPATCFGLV